MFVPFVKDLSFDIAFFSIHTVDMQLLTRFILERSRTHQFTDTGIHIEVEIQFRHFANVTLYIDGSLLRIDTASQILSQDRLCTFADVCRTRMRSQGVPVCNKEKAIILILHLQKTLYCSEVIPQMQITCWPDATYYCFHF